MTRHASDHASSHLLHDIDVVLHLRELGAEGLVDFQAMPVVPDTDQWRQNAVELGLEELVPAGEALLEKVMRQGVFFERRGHEYSFKCDSVSDVAIAVTEQHYARRFTPEGRREVSEGFLSPIVANLIADVAHAREVALPLAVALRPHAEMLSRVRGPATVASVAFALELPVLRNVTTAELIKIRQDEGEYFERFRLSLRTAMREQLRARPGAKPDEVAREIQMEIIEPNLAEIRSRLSAAERTLARSSFASVALGTLVTICGLLVGSAPAALVGLAAVTEGLAVPAQQYFGKRGEIELSDMYFLWRAIKHAEKHA